MKEIMDSDKEMYYGIPRVVGLFLKKDLKEPYLSLPYRIKILTMELKTLINTKGRI